MKKNLLMTPLVVLTTVAPIAAIVACDNKNASDDSNSNRQKSYQGKVFALPTNLSLGMDLLVEDGKGHMNDTS